MEKNSSIQIKTEAHLGSPAAGMQIYCKDIGVDVALPELTRWQRFIKGVKQLWHKVISHFSMSSLKI